MLNTHDYIRVATYICEIIQTSRIYIRMYYNVYTLGWSVFPLFRLRYSNSENPVPMHEKITHEKM